MAKSRLRRPVARHVRRPGEQVPRPPPSTRHAPSGFPSPSPDTEARRWRGTESHGNIGQKAKDRRQTVQPTIRVSYLSTSLSVKAEGRFRIGRSPLPCPLEGAAMPCVARARDGGGRACTGQRNRLPARPPKAARLHSGFSVPARSAIRKALQKSPASFRRLPGCRRSRINSACVYPRSIVFCKTWG